MRTAFGTAAIAIIALQANLLAAAHEQEQQMAQVIDTAKIEQITSNVVFVITVPATGPMAVMAIAPPVKKSEPGSGTGNVGSLLLWPGM